MKIKECSEKTGQKIKYKEDQTNDKYSNQTVKILKWCIVSTLQDKPSTIINQQSRNTLQASIQQTMKVLGKKLQSSCTQGASQSQFMNVNVVGGTPKDTIDSKKSNQWIIQSSHLKHSNYHALNILCEDIALLRIHNAGKSRIKEKRMTDLKRQIILEKVNLYDC